MQEEAANHVLFDFEIIVLATLIFGLVFYELFRRIRRKPLGGSH